MNIAGQRVPISLFISTWPVESSVRLEHNLEPFE